MITKEEFWRLDERAQGFIAYIQMAKKSGYNEEETKQIYINHHDIEGLSDIVEHTCSELERVRKEIAEEEGEV